MQEHEFVRRIFEATNAIVEARDASPDALLQLVPRDLEEVIRIVRGAAHEVGNCPFLDEAIDRLKQYPQALQVVAWVTTTLSFQEQRAAMERARAKGVTETPYLPAFALSSYLTELCNELESAKAQDGPDSTMSQQHT